MHDAGVILNPYLLNEARLHDDVDAKEAFNKVFWKTTSTFTTYALTLKDFLNFVKSQGQFLTPPPSEGPRLTPTWVVGFD